MASIKKICQEMAATPQILTFSEIAQAAANGAVLGQKVNSPLIGAVLGVSLEAGKRAVLITEELLQQMHQDPKPKNPKKTKKPS